MFKVDLGLDIATAVSVFTAAIAFIWSNIRENRINREQLNIEKQKDRNERLGQFKLEKTAEVIRFLNEKMHKLIVINDNIDRILMLDKRNTNPKEVKIKLSKELKKEFYDKFSKSEINTKQIPEEFFISKQIEKINLISCEISNYLSHHPYICFLDDEIITDNVNRLVELCLNLSITKNQAGSDNRTILIKIRDYEVNPLVFGRFLRKDFQYKKDSNLYNETLERLPDLEALLMDKKMHKEVELASLEVFNTLSGSIKSSLYMRFVINQLFLMARHKKEWRIVSENVKETISSLSNYSYQIVAKE